MASVTPEARREAIDHQIAVGRKLEGMTKTEGWKVLEVSVVKLAEIAWSSAKAATDWDSFKEARVRAQTYESVVSEVHREIAEAKANAAKQHEDLQSTKTTNQ